MRLPAARIFYFEKEKASLILEAIRPCTEKWRRRAGTDQVWLKAHWRQGPHLDVIGDMPEDQFDDEFMPIVRGVVGGWLIENPSLTSIDHVDYRHLSERLALFELETAPLTPIAKNNSIERVWHEPNPDIFGVVELAEAQGHYNTASLDVIYEALHLKTTNPNLLYLRLAELMALTGNLVRMHGLPRSFISYRSHAEYFFANHDPKGHFRARLDEADAQLGSDIDRIVRSAHGVYVATETIDRAFPHLAGWYRRCVELSREVYNVAEQNAELLGKHERLRDLADQLVGALNVTLDPAGERKTSDVETYIGDMSELFRQVSHIAYRSMVNFFYGLLPVLSVPPVQKYGLCHLVSNSCERVFDKSWQQVVDEGRPKPGASA